MVDGRKYIIKKTDAWRAKINIKKTINYQQQHKKNRQLSLHSGVFLFFFIYFPFLAFFPRKQEIKQTKITEMGVHSVYYGMHQSIGCSFLKVHSIVDTLSLFYQFFLSLRHLSFSHFMLLIAFAGSNRKDWGFGILVFFLPCGSCCYYLQKIGFFFGEKSTHTHTHQTYKKMEVEQQFFVLFFFKKIIESSLGEKGGGSPSAVKRGVNKTQNSNCICRTYISIHIYLGWKIDWKITKGKKKFLTNQNLFLIHFS